MWTSIQPWHIRASSLKIIVTIIVHSIIYSEQLYIITIYQRQTIYYAELSHMKPNPKDFRSLSIFTGSPKNQIISKVLRINSRLSKTFTISLLNNENVWHQTSVCTLSPTVALLLQKQTNKQNKVLRKFNVQYRNPDKKLQHLSYTVMQT